MIGQSYCGNEGLCMWLWGRSHRCPPGSGQQGAPLSPNTEFHFPRTPRGIHSASHSATRCILHILLIQNSSQITLTKSRSSTYRSGENAFCEIAAATVGLLYTLVDGRADVSVSRVSGLTGTGNIDTALQTVSCFMAASVIFTAKIWG